jgi:hypothetical protein
MTNQGLTMLQEVYFDLCDLLNSKQMKGVSLKGFQEFKTLEEFLQEQKVKIEQIETIEGE